jgi:hypothetical protein
MDNTVSIVNYDCRLCYWFSHTEFKKNHHCRRIDGVCFDGNRFVATEPVQLVSEAYKRLQKVKIPKEV